MQTKITLYPARANCPSIAGTMKGIIMSIVGVEQVTVNYEAKTIAVTFDNLQTNSQSIIDAIGLEMGLATTTVKPLDKIKVEKEV